MFVKSTYRSVAQKLSRGLVSGEIDLSGECDRNGAFRHRMQTWFVILASLHLFNMVYRFCVSILQFHSSAVSETLATLSQVLLLYLIWVSWKDVADFAKGRRTLRKELLP